MTSHRSREVRYYRCRSHAYKKNCTGSVINAEGLESAITEAINNSSKKNTLNYDTFINYVKVMKFYAEKFIQQADGLLKLEGKELPYGNNRDAYNTMKKAFDNGYFTNDEKSIQFLENLRQKAEENPDICIESVTGSIEEAYNNFKDYMDFREKTLHFSNFDFNTDIMKILVDLENKTGTIYLPGEEIEFSV